MKRFLLRWWFETAAVLLLLVPMLVLVGAGVVWLGSQGWLLWWMLGAMATTALVWGGLRYRHRPSRRARLEASSTLTSPDPTWAPHEQSAWETVSALASESDGAILEDHRLMLDAAKRTIAAVAKHYHPEQEDPTLEFTLPELLLLTERVSARLRLVLLEHVPLSHRLKARALIRAWGLRPMVSAGIERGLALYSFVRIARAVSPLHALVGEVRDHLVGDLYDRVQTNVRRRIVRLWIEEVGRAAIDLYSGRLVVDALELASAAAREGLTGAAAATPGSLRLLIAGRSHAGKSTLVRAMLGELGEAIDVKPLTASFEGYELRQEGLPLAYVIDSPGIADEAGMKDFVKRAFACDLIVWVVAARAADLDVDRVALDALRERFAAAPQRRMPPLVVVVTHLDRLVQGEWQPPYKLDPAVTADELSIRAELDRVAEQLYVPFDAIVPMRLDTKPPHNIDLLWLRLEALAEEAQRARWVRLLRGALEERGWRSAWRQVAGARRLVRRLMRR